MSAPPAGAAAAAGAAVLLLARASPASWRWPRAGPAEPEAADRRHRGADRRGGAVETGLRLLREGRARVLLVSGVHRDVTLADLAHRAAMGPGDLAGRVDAGA